MLSVGVFLVLATQLGLRAGIRELSRAIRSVLGFKFAIRCSTH